MDTLAPEMVGFFFGLGFWSILLLATEFLALFVVVHFGRGSLGAASILLALAVLFFLGVNTPALIYNNPLTAFSVFIFYVPVGIFWSMLKWRWLVREQRGQFNERVKEFVAESQVALTRDDLSWFTNRGVEFEKDPTLTPVSLSPSLGGRVSRTENKPFVSAERKSELLTELAEGRIPDQIIPAFRERFRTMLGKPSAWEYKDRITSWILFWPWSIVWYVICDLVIDLMNHLWLKIVNVYVAIADKEFADVDERLIKK